MRRRLLEPLLLLLLPGTRLLLLLLLLLFDADTIRSVGTADGLELGTRLIVGSTLGVWLGVTVGTAEGS